MANITKRGGSYSIRVSAGYDTSGKQIVKTMTWKPPIGMSERKAEKEVQREAVLFEEKVRNGQLADGRIKFQDFAERWFSDYAEIQLRPRTVARYRELTERVYPVLGHIYIDKIRPAHLMSFYKDLSATTVGAKFRCKIDLKDYLKKRGVTKAACAESAGVSIAVLTSVFQDKNIEEASAQKIATALNVLPGELFEAVSGERTLSGKTVLHYHRLISTIMQTAVKWQVVVSNPCDRVDPPKTPQKTAEYLDAEQAVRLLELLQEREAPIQYRTAVTVLLFTGMRGGELLGLKWSDVDFEKQMVSISRSSLYLPGKGVFEDETKTDASNRVIRIPQTAAEALRVFRKWQIKERLALGEKWNNTDYIFTTRDGSPMHPDTLSGWFHDFIQKTDLPPIHLHSLRHTNATINIANGVAITTVAGILGHANATTTAKIYAHSIKSAQAAAADMMDDILSKRIV